MIRIAKLFLTGMILCMAFTSCQKEYSTENGGLPGGGGSGGTQSGTAIFTLTGAPGACSTPVISGIYTAGTVMDASNTVILTVDVLVVGTYVISTGTNHGISFISSGTFTITGPQILILTGTGTPTTSGTYNYTPGTNGCSFQITVGGSGPVAAGTLDCTTATLAGVYTQGISLSSANTVSIPVNVTTAGSYSITTTTTNGCTFSGSGNLPLGAQTIVLTGSGIPVNSGAILFPVVLGTSTCSFSITFAAGTPPPTDYLQCKIDGVLTTFNANLDGDITPLLLPNTIAISGNTTIASTEYLDVTVQSISAITTGTYLQDLGVSFCTSRYFDPVSGQGWQASTTIPSSPPLKVIITSVSSSRVTGTFSGQYFDLNGTGTNSKQITEGAFSVPLP